MVSLGLSVLNQHRLVVTARIILAAVGGYLFAALCTAGFAVALPLPRPQAVLAATQLSFAVYCIWIIWAFSTRNVLRAWWVATGLNTLAVTLLFSNGGSL